MARFFCCLALSCFLFGCGQSGALYLPKHEKPIRQITDDVMS
jgi:predicted small lipoprotein YifL